MTGSIKISNPEEVKGQVLRAAAVLDVYKDLINEESGELALVQLLAEQTLQTVEQRRNGTQVAMEQNRKVDSADSRPAQYNEQFYIRQLEVYEGQLRMVQKCMNALEKLQSDYKKLSDASTKLSGEGKLLSRKIGSLLDDIIAAI